MTYQDTHCHCHIVIVTYRLYPSKSKPAPNYLDDYLQFTHVHYACVHTCTHAMLVHTLFATHTCTVHMYAHTQTHPHIRTPTHTHAHTHTHIHTHTQTLMQTPPQLVKHLSMNPVGTNNSVLSVEYLDSPFSISSLASETSWWKLKDSVVQTVHICLCTCRGKVKVVVMNGVHLARQQLIQHSNQHSSVYT